MFEEIMHIDCMTNIAMPLSRGHEKGRTTNGEIYLQVFCIYFFSISLSYLYL